MAARADRIERIQELLEDRRHPERRPGLFSATNLTRLALRFSAMGLAAYLVHRLVGGTDLEVLLAAGAVGAADYWVGRLWRRIARKVQQAWTTVGLVVACGLVLAVVTGQAGPDSAAMRWIRGWIDAKNAELDQRRRGTVIPIDAAAAAGPDWRLLLENGGARQGTIVEARQWCAELGSEWGLPPGLGGWPELDPWPNFGTIFYVWTMGGSGIQIGDGQRPAVGVSGASRPTEVRPVFCLKRGA